MRSPKNVPSTCTIFFFISSLLIIRLPCQQVFIYCQVRFLIEYNPVCVLYHLCLHRVFWRQMRFAGESKLSNTYQHLIVDLLFYEAKNKFFSCKFLRRDHIRFHWNNRYFEKTFRRRGVGF